MADALYDVWAQYRGEVTGRGPLSVVLEKRRAQGSQMCREQGAAGAGDDAACELPVQRQQVGAGGTKQQ